MKTIMLTILDDATEYNFAATLLRGENDAETRILNWVGYYGYKKQVILTCLSDCAAIINPFKWKDQNLIKVHCYIKKNFGSLKTGDVIDAREI